jgi:hypothetical protein
MGRVQGGARAAFAKVCKMSVAGGCLQTLMTECSHGRVSVNSELGPRPHNVLFAFKKKSSGDTPNIFLNCVQ